MDRADYAKCTILLSLLLFCLCAFPWLDLPGPQHDELYFVSVLPPFAYMEPLYGWSLGETQIRVMLHSYAGALKVWLMKLVFEGFPATVVTVRAFGLLLGAGAIVLTWLWVRRHYGEPVAVAATLLVATDPTFIHTLRMDFGPVALGHLLKMAGLVSVSSWLRHGRWPCLALGMFLFGLGLWDKATFVWFLVAATGAALWVFPRQFRERLRPKALLVAVLALMVGASPLLLFNLTAPAATLADRMDFEWKPLKLYVAYLALNGEALLYLTGGDELDSAPPPRTISAPGIAQVLRTLGWTESNLNGILLATLVVLLPITLGTRYRKGILFSLLVGSLMYAQMFVLRSGGGSVHHLVMIYPFPAIFLAASVAALGEKYRTRHLAPAVIGVAIIFNLLVNTRHLAVYTWTGGTRHFTDAVYRMIPELERASSARFYLLDWGISNSMAFLAYETDLRWRDLPELYMGSRSLKQSASLLQQLAADPRTRFVLRGKERTVFPFGRQAVEQLLVMSRLRKTAEFPERTGVTAYEIYAPESNHSDAGP